MMHNGWQATILLIAVILSIGLILYSLYNLHRLYNLRGSRAYIKWLSVLSVLLVFIYFYYIYYLLTNSFDYAHTIFAFAYLLSASFIWLITEVAYAIAVDLTKSAAVEHYFATHDDLTGLPNLTFFNEQLELVLNDAAQNAYEVALLIVDLNRFQLINETIGYFGGDVMLQEVAQRIQRSLRKTDLVARLGGDEFAVLINPVVARGHLHTISHNIAESVQEPLAVDNQPTDVGVSIGVSLYPEHAKNGLELIESARGATLTAKRSGTSVHFYDPDNQDDTSEDIHIIGMLQRAVQNKQLSILYQPQVTLAEMQLASVEALIRWDHPKYGMLDPGHFIPYAERAGLIYEINLWLVDEVIKVLQRWKKQSLFLPIAINLTVKGFMNKDFQQKLDTSVKAKPWIGKLLKIELTETSTLDDENEVFACIKKYQSNGIRFSLDDYGTKHASLEYLKKLPFDEFKVDRSFMINAVSDNDSRTIVYHAIEIAEQLNLAVAAEGIENQEVLNFARECNFNLVQGYYFSPAKTAKSIEEYVNQNGMDAHPYLRSN